MVKPSVNKALVKARSHLKRGETIEAEKLYKAILATFPKNKKAKEGLASLKIYLRSSNNKNAPQEIIENLVSFYNKGQLELVIKKAQEITKNYPETFIVWNILGVAFARTKRLEKAVYALQRATFIKPDYSEGFYNMGNALKDQGNFEEAVAAYKKAISCKSDYPAAFYNMGTAFKNQDKFDEAMKAFKKAIMLKPDFFEAYNNLGNVFQEQGNYKEAINSYKEAISIKQDYAKAYKNMANALGEQGQSDKAVVSFEKALSLEPNYAEVHRQLSSLIKYKSNNAQMKLVSQLLKKPELKDADRCHLNYAFAKMNEDLGNLGIAFENYVAGVKSVEN